MSRKPDPEHDVHQRKEVCAVVHLGVDGKISTLEDDVKSINRKINASMVFTICTLVGILSVLATLILRGQI